ncbi:YcgL domain-containing protein [Thiomicrorhabdus chilensis]|uniref:YcgL domain-containing protein n=1 Tax=Thiomicrorhabdus chilensis TaxID=63656 RepID=UPI000411B0A9|nr:YcgL domain-containing protein [Thiomicrorhabdus chilensis]
MTTITVSVFKSPKKAELYLYVPQDDGLEKLPDELLVMFGEPAHVLDFELSPERKLAREDSQTVIEALQKKGYYMQMPPNEVEKFGDMAPPPEHLDNIC